MDPRDALISLSAEWGVGSPGNLLDRTISIGAYDRFNYGDLLFPIVLDYVADQMSLPRPRHFSVTDADMTRFGGEETGALVGRRSAVDRALRSDGLGVILGGGEVLGATWGQAAVSLLPFPLDLTLLGVRKFVSQRLFDSIGKTGLGGSWPTPYVPSGAAGALNVLVTNAIGASSLELLDGRTKAAVVAPLSSAVFVSVRDAKGRELLAREGVPSALAPDSVAILGRIRPPGLRAKEGVLAFQCSRAWLRSRKKATADALAELSTDFSSIRLLPIGLAGGHADQSALQALRLELKSRKINNVELVDVSTLWDVADAIAESDVFVGTSLHGSITAMAYGIPSVALEGIRKLDAYLDTWGGGLSPFAVGTSAIRDAVAVSLRQGGMLADRAGELDRLSWANSERVLNAATGRRSE
jgi:hypothetical protein